jgi:hypothetical protein
VLEGAGVVTTTRRGREKLHYLNAAPINDIAERWMNRYERERAGALADLKRALENPAMEPTRFVYTCDAVRLTVTHERFATGSPLLDAVSGRTEQTGGWPELLANLKTLLETGDTIQSAHSSRPSG